VQMFGTPKAEAVQYIELPHEAAPQTVAVTSDVSESAVLGAASATGADTTLSPTTHKADPPAQAHTNFANQNLGGQAGALAHVAASPQTYFEYAITLLVVLALALGAYVWFYEMKQGHYRHDVYIVALSLALIALLYAADAYVFTDPVLASTLMIYST
jgi:magnesium-transporting ATPase (P-type)